MTKSNQYSTFSSGDFIPKNRKRECANEAQTLVVWAFSNFDNLDNLPDPDFYLRRERIRQLYTELYKEKNITKFRNTKISIERKAAA